MQETRRYKTSTVIAGFHLTDVIDVVVKHSLAEHVPIGRLGQRRTQRDPVVSA
jgi:hypothetical protein